MADLSTKNMFIEFIDILLGADEFLDTTKQDLLCFRKKLDAQYQDHKWTTRKVGGSPVDPFEYETFCDNCGASKIDEDAGEWCPAGRPRDE